MPMEQLVSAYDAVWEAGKPAGIRDIGIYAVDSLRLEKCYRSWKQDLEIGYSPLAASLDRFVNLKKPSFVGREALFRESEKGPKTRFVPLILADDRLDAPFCATVFKEGERVGIVTSGGYGHRLRQSIALAYVRTDLAGEGTALEIEIFGERVRVIVKREPLYDPQNLRLRA